MTTYAAPPRPSRSLLPITAGVLGLIGAVGIGGTALLLIGLGGFHDDSGVVWWVYLVAAGALVQAWGAVQLLRRRGWLLLAVGALPSVPIAVALVALWREYHELPSPAIVVTAASLVAGLLALLPPVRRWARPGASPSRGIPGPEASR